MRHSLAGLVLAMVALQALAGGPAQAAEVAAQNDSLTLSPAEAPYTRYFTLYALSAKKREAFIKAFTFHTYSLSREATLDHPPVLVTPDLLRADIRDYDWSPETFERLADEDPYFHATIEEVTHTKEKRRTAVYHGFKWARNDADNDWVLADKVSADVTVTKKVKKFQAAAPWLPTKETAALILTTQSKVPLVRADWFVAQTAIQRGDHVGYYDFLGLGKKTADFEALIAADPDKSIKVKKEIAAILAKSGVAIHNRRIVRLQSITGAYWFTEDFKTNKDKENILQFINGDAEPPEGDASERYGVLPNGLFATWLQNADGVRQDFVPPDTIATDGHTSSNDRNIYAGKSCFCCHVEGLRPIDDYSKKIFTGNIQLKSINYEKYKHLQQLYLSDLKDQWQTDTDAYAKVLLRVNGLTPAKNAAGYERAWDDYIETDVDLDQYALELGTTPVRFCVALHAYEEHHGPIPPALAGLTQEPCVPIIRDYAEQFFPLAEEMLLEQWGQP